MKELIIKYGTQPFGYNWKEGELDCFHFTANIVRDLTGKDYLSSFREKYHSKKGAWKLIKDLGYINIATAVSGETGILPVPTLLAKDGDIVCGKNHEKEDMIGICYNNYGFFIGNDSKILKKSLRDCICSWSIR